jgi:hypothetical protein
MNYQGICKHLLAAPSRAYWGSNTFAVYLKNAYKNGNINVAYMLYVETNVCNDVVRMTRVSSKGIQAVPVNVTVDGVAVRLPYQTSCYTIDYVASAVRLQTTFNLGVTFNGRSKTEVYVPSDTYGGLMQGMCGADTGICRDDFRTKSGTYLNNVPQSGAAIGDSYVVSDPDVSSTSQCATSATSTPSSPASSIVKGCYHIVNTTGCFRNAIATVTSSVAYNFYNACIYDASLDSTDTICDSIKAFADHCKWNGVSADWRTATNCLVSQGRTIVQIHRWPKRKDR